MAEDKVAIVTGGSRGIGRAICLDLAAAGYHVVVNYRADRAAADETLGAVENAGGHGEVVGFDVADAKATAEAVGDLVRRHGKSLDVLVNNAGVTADGLFAMMPEPDWHKVLATTLDGFYNVTRPVLMRMVGRRKGSIVTIASVAAQIANRGQVNYAAAKAGVIGASRTLAAEVAPLGIRVNVVAPGIIATAMTKDLPVDKLLPLIPMGRVGRPEEIARAVRFLCSDDASYITGQVLAVNGGMA